MLIALCTQLPTLDTDLLVPNRIFPTTRFSGRLGGRAGYTSQITCHAIELPAAVKPGRTRRRKLSKVAEVPERGQVSEELLEQIRNQVEYYFSYENLCKDEQLRRKVLGNVEGFVSLAELLGKPHMRALSASFGTIKASLRQSQHLVVNSNKGVRRRIPVRNLPRTAPRALANARESEEVKMLLVVAAALIDGRGRVLLAKRPEGKTLGGLWEFPGGKVDGGERPEAALIRELKEELNIQVAYEDLKPITFASHAYDDFHLLMPLYECSRWKGEPKGQEGQELAWVGANDLDKYDMPQADQPLIAPVQAVVQRLAQSVISDAA